MTKELIEFIQEGTLAIIPVKIDEKVIGVICAQYFVNQIQEEQANLAKKDISSDDFQQLCSLIEHLNFCLTMMMLR